MKNFRNKIAKYALLLLFICYYVNISFFTHFHVVNGVTIVHSHFYKQTAEDKNQLPKHKHSSTEIQLISSLSHFLSTGETPNPFVACDLPVSVRTKAILPEKHVFFSSYSDDNLLRAPPSRT